MKDLQKAKRAPKNYSMNPKLDRMYARNVRCPYCKAVIAKYTTTCIQCGITKEQIVNASHLEAKEILTKKKKGKVLWTKTIPADLHFTKFVLVLIFLGLFGGHHFYVGRRIKGFFMLGSVILFIIGFFVFPFGNPDAGIDMHPAREAASWNGVWFPMDVPLLITAVIWFVDWFAVVVFSTFRYPVRIKGKD